MVMGPIATALGFLQGIEWKQSVVTQPNAEIDMTDISNDVIIMMHNCTQMELLQYR